MVMCRTKDLDINDVYVEMLKNRTKVLEEAVTSKNSIHADVEAVMNEFADTVKSEIDSDAIKEKLRNLEKYDLTTADKSIIKNIEKLVDTISKSFETFEKFKKDLKYDYVLAKKDEPQAVGEDEVDENATPVDSKDELEAADENFEAPSDKEEVDPWEEK